MRYTEAKLQPLSDDLMADLDKETVDFVPNYDETTEEPTVLPTPFPNLLVNGSAGIAVGMATNIPPHNLTEVIDGIIWTIEHREESDDEKRRGLRTRITGPDFPTGGFIVGRAGIDAAYQTGRGSLTVRGRTAIEDIGKGDRQAIIINEIPYQLNKVRLIEKIADLVRDKALEGISDLRDESDRDGMRIVIELKRGEVAEVVLNNLYKQTPLQTTFGVIMLAIAGGRPRVLGLLDMVERFIAFRHDVVQRRTAFDLRKAEARAHILEGLKIALDQLDAVITLIRAARNPADARTGLMEQFELTQIQAQAILDMQLQRLTGLERQKVIDELTELLLVIERLREILGSESLLMGIVVDELRAVQTKYGDDRRTEIVDDPGELRIEDLIAEEDMAITVSNTGYVKRTAVTEYRSQRRGGKGRIGMRTRDEDFLTHLFVASTHAYILIFSDLGRVYWLKVHTIPDVGPSGRGKAIANLVSMEAGEKIAALLAVRDWPEEDGERYIITGTRRGIIKKTDLRAFRHPRHGGIISGAVDEGDAVISAEMTDGNGEVFIGTRQGKAIRFPERDVRPTGRVTRGVRGVNLRPDDEVVAMAVVRPGGTLLTVTENGYGKRTELDEYRVQSRGGLGIISIQTTVRNGRVAGIAYVEDEDELMLITQQGKVLRMDTKDIRPIGRATQGVRLIEIDDEDHVVSLARLARLAPLVPLEEEADATVESGTEGGPADDTDSA